MARGGRQDGVARGLTNQVCPSSSGVRASEDVGNGQSELRFFSFRPDNLGSRSAHSGTLGGVGGGDAAGTRDEMCWSTRLVLVLEAGGFDMQS
jgi:hypothetical protein